jgi:DNA excision repair protein ERCC-4
VHNPVVLVDTREHAEDVLRYIKESGCNVVKTKLEVGDYVAGRFVFERKSVNDFINSIIDGRLFDQALRLRGLDLKPVIVVEGNLWEELRYRKISPNAVLGAQLALHSMDIGIIYTEDKTQTGALLCLAAKREAKEGIKIPSIKKKTDIKALQIALLASLPGIGPKRAEDLLKKYGTPLNALLNYKSWDIDSKRHVIIKRVLETPYSASSSLDDFIEADASPKATNLLETGEGSRRLSSSPTQHVQAQADDDSCGTDSGDVRQPQSSE